MGVSAGTRTGRVRLVLVASDETTFDDGDILVTRMTDPTMIHLMNRAGGIVCDIGGMTSHPAIVCRELGVPCVVATGNGTRVLADGQFVSVNGSTGEVHVLPDP